MPNIGNATIYQLYIAFAKELKKKIEEKKRGKNALIKGSLKYMCYLLKIANIYHDKIFQILGVRYRWYKKRNLTKHNLDR